VSLEFVLAVPLLLVFLMGPPVLIMLTLLRGLEDAGGGRPGEDALLHPSLDTLVLGGRFWTTAGFAGALSLALGIGIFVVVPRLRTELFAHETMADPLPVTGFDNEVDLNDIGSIKQNTAEVMKVVVRHQGRTGLPPGVGPYWRGIALGHYDGRRWQAVRTEGAKRVGAGPRSQIPVVNFYPERLRPLLRDDLGLTVTQECTLQPLDTKVLFGLYAITHVRSNRFRRVHFDLSSQAVSLHRSQTSAVQYTARSRVLPASAALQARLRAASGPLPAPIRRHYLSLPRGLSPRIRALAESLAPPDRYPTQYDRVSAVEAHFFEPDNFTYTLDVESDEGREPNEAFLFETRTGHCSFFASAMVILLRHIGVPARMVNGFCGGEWNGFGEFYLVRQADAHSWVEVFFPGGGWGTFDPTPAGSRMRAGSTGLLSFATKYVEYLDTLWLAHVVGYTADPSEEVALSLLARLRAVASAFDDMRAPDLSNLIPEKAGAQRWPDAAVYLLAGVLVFGIVVAATVARLYGLRLLRQIRGRSGGRPQVRFYGKLLDIMRNKGYPKPVSMAPMEFVRQVAGALGPHHRLVAFVTERFCAARYGGQTPCADDLVQVRGCLSDLSRLPKRTAPEGDPAGPRLGQG